jgi:hypothetical protein
MKALKYEFFAIAVPALAAMPSITLAESNTGLGGPAYTLDPNYTLVSGPPGQICQIGSPPCAVYSQAVYPGWLTPSSYSNWITPFTSVNGGAPPGGGSVASPPYRALIMRAPIVASLAQEEISPHRMSDARLIVRLAS